MTALEIDTPHGPARAHLRPAESPRAALVLGHGAGGGVNARDLVAVADAAVAAQVTVALVEQPYRVAGRRSPAPVHQLDTAWTAVVDHLRGGELERLPLVTGGRSAGARVACRTAGTIGAAGVLCIAFPLVPPGRSADRTRLPELEAVRVPVLVIQGDRDSFGIPPEGPARTVVTVPGTHSFRTGFDAIAGAAQSWLERILAPTPSGASPARGAS